MKLVLQISSGSWNKMEYMPRELENSLDRVVSAANVYGVIIGWGPGHELYMRLREYLTERGIKMFLWLPVFSALDDLMESDMSVDIWGKPMSRAGDGFDFCCPTSARNIGNVLDVFERRFAGCGFDGVFLDRVRGESFARGIPGVMSCCCGRCRDAYAGRGVDLRDVGKELSRQGDSFFDVYLREDGLLGLKNPLAAAFFDAKRSIVSESVGRLCGYFKGRGLTVGLDLFAPVVGRFVGQDYRLLTQYADFVKPMLYRRTLAPAGMVYELELARRSAPGAAGWDIDAGSPEFLASQVRAMSGSGCEVFPGVEINYDSELVPTDPAYIRESMEVFRKAGAAGAVLSWNIMTAPEENLRAAIS